jgi:hypothetical protein
MPMKLLRVLLALTALVVLAGLAHVRQATEPPGLKMVDAGDKFLASLTPEQKGKATFAFDDKERLNWHFIPLQDANRKPTRKGLPLFDMTDAQKDAARALLRAGTSANGFTKATTIMTLEAILHELEKGGRTVRDPGWYFFTVFGTPAKTGKWGWRVEGHHLSLNFTLDGGQIVAATPTFFGANPAAVKDGPRKGLVTLPEAEDLARELFKSLDEDQKKLAHQGTQFGEVQGQTAAPKVGPPKGLAGARMTAPQQTLLVKLLRSYADRMPPEVAETEMNEVKKAGVDKVHIAFAGSAEPGKPHTYRIQGPTFVVEFLNVQADSAQNSANHIHSCWRNTHGDFGVTN